MNTVTIAPPETDASASADARPPYLDALQPFAGLRVLVVVANDGPPHAVCARCFGSGRHVGDVHWLQDASAARVVLANGGVDLAILDEHQHGRLLLDETARLAPGVPVIYFCDELAVGADEHAPWACLPRSTAREEEIAAAMQRVVPQPDCARGRPSPRSEDAPVIEFPRPAHSGGDGDDAFCAGVLRHIPVIVGRIDAHGHILDLAGAGLARLGLELERERLIGTAFAEVFPAGAEALCQALAGESAHFETCGQAGSEGIHCVRFDLFPDHDQGGAVGILAQELPTRRGSEDEVLRAVDSERNRIGADLHDDVGQLLTGITCLSTALVERLRGRDDLAAEDAVAIAQTAREALAQVRSLAHGLAPVHLSRQGLAPAVEEFADLIRRMHDVDLRIDLPRGPLAVDGDMGTHVFRIIQEAVANAIRHGHAHRIGVSLRRAGPQYRLTVRDDGCGFSTDTPSPSSGSGLRLMEYRASLIGGSLRVTSASERGTTIDLSFTPSTPRTHETAC